MNATTRILLGLFAGAAAGLLLVWHDPALAIRVADVFEPIGHLWLNALQMTVVPLVISLIIVGVNTTADAAISGSVARRAIVTIIILLIAGGLFTAFAAPLMLRQFTHDSALMSTLGNAATTPAGLSGWAAQIGNLIPNNVIMAAAQSAMLPLVVFTLFFGFALTRIEAAGRAQIVGFFKALSDAMIVTVRWVLWAAPLGVFALIFSVCARSGYSMLSALGLYMLTEIVMYLAVMVGLYLVAKIIGRENFRTFALGILPAQVVAASTQSSLASLPAMLDCADRRLHYPRVIGALALPLAVTLFRIATPIQMMVSSAFIAWAFGVDLSIVQLVAGALLGVVISLGAIGLPGQVSFMTSNLPVAQSMGLPLGPLGLMLAVDTLPDIFATLCNVTADMTVASVVARRTSADESQATNTLPDGLS